MWRYKSTDIEKSEVFEKKKLTYRNKCDELLEEYQDEEMAVLRSAEAGFYHLRAARYEDASNEFSYVVQAKSEDLDVYLRSQGLLGLCYAGMGNFEKAEEWCRSMIQSSGHLNAKDLLPEAYHNLARVYSAQNRLDDGYEAYSKSIMSLEGIRENLKIPAYKISMLADRIEIYEEMVQHCLRTGRVKDAFNYVERSKSRALIDMLSSRIREIKPKNLSDNELTKFNQERQELQALYIYQREIFDYARKESLESKESAIKAVQAQIDEKERKIRTVYPGEPESALFESVSPTGLEEIENIMDENTLVLQYFLTENRLLIMGLRKGGSVEFWQVEVASKRLEDSVRQLTAPEMERVADRMRRGVPVQHLVKTTKEQLEELYDLLLRAAEDFIEEDHIIKRLVILPHKFLHHVPFHALFRSQKDSYLIDEYEITISPSASALRLCRDRNPKRHNTCLVLANPLMNPSQVEGLKYIEIEANQISSYFSPNSSKVFLKNDATCDRLWSGDLSAYDIIHFACHGQFDDSQERLSSFLRLADRDLRISDIFDLKLDASLVVLSGCQTGLSKVLTGDELIGLARGFFYAGTPSLICTLWSVNDRSTADFMGDFYKNFLELNNRSKSSALRLSQLHLKEKYEHPYFWAPFFLIGDYI